LTVPFEKLIAQQPRRHGDIRRNPRRFTAREQRPQDRISALGQKQTSRHLQPMSALPQKADIAECDGDVRFVPKADSCTAANAALNTNDGTDGAWCHPWEIAN
jgi:hypothetical protein